jgi:spermidine synthase
MKPRIIVAQTTSCTQLNLDFIEHDGRFFLECEGRQVDGSQQGFATRKLIKLMSLPFRPARQPRIVILGLGLGHAVAAARESLPQEKASFVILPEATELADLISKNLTIDPLDDERVHLDNLDPFTLLPAEYSASQGIFADLDHLEALSPKNWAITSPNVLGNFQERLKTGGLPGAHSKQARNGS